MPPHRTTRQKAPKHNSNVSELPSLGSRTCSGILIELFSYHDEPNNQSLVAVYHNDYRQVWITEYDADLYTYGRAKGPMANDITCFYGPHQNWGPTRENWPDIIFQYKADTEKPKNDGTPAWLYTDEGWLVLDYRSVPVLAFNMPLTISSVCEDWLLEAIMRDNYHDHIGVQDIQARMPGTLSANGSEPNRTGTISMRMTRFRKIAGCLSWAPKVGSESIENYLASILPEECKQANSTRGFRNLWPYERAEIELQNIGQFPNKARPGRKDFSEKGRYDKIVRAWNRYMQLKLAHEAEHSTTVPMRRTLQDYLKAVGLSDFDTLYEATATNTSLRSRRQSTQPQAPATNKSLGSRRPSTQAPRVASGFRGTGAKSAIHTTGLATLSRSSHIPTSSQTIWNIMTPDPSSTSEQGDLSTLLEVDIFGGNSTTPVPTTTHSTDTPGPITTNQLSDLPSSFLESDDRFSASFNMPSSSYFGSGPTTPVLEDNHSAWFL